MTIPHRSAPGVRDLVAQTEQLPMLPSVVMRLLALDPRSDRYFETLLEVAEDDPTFAVRLIRLANAPTSAPRTPIVSIRQAVVRLGAKECTGLVTAVAIARVFLPTTEDQRNLWLHSLQVAVAARAIAGLMSGVSTEQAYTAGLLHDIGRFVMFEGAAADLSRVDETQWHSPQQLLDAEHSLLGYDHVQLGVLVCRRWCIPETITEVVRLHHAYPGEHASVSIGPIVAAVQLADLVSMMLIEAPGFADQEPLVIAEELTERCAAQHRPNPPVSPSVLAQRIASIRDDASEIAERLLNVTISRKPA